MSAPTPDQIRRALAELDLIQQKIVTGMLSVMMKEPGQVRDREWVKRQLADLTLLAGEFEADSPQVGVQAVQNYLSEHAEVLLRASFLLFQRVGLDMAARAASGFTFEEALQQGMTYLPPDSRDDAR